MIITTSGDGAVRLSSKARSLSEKYNLPYVAREKMPLELMLSEICGKIFVVNDARGLSYIEKGKSEVFYHPNIALLRIISLTRGGSDNFADACGLRAGMTFFDATLGLAADATVAAYITGTAGRCVGIEKIKPLYILVKEGLSDAAHTYPALRDAASLVNPVHGDNLAYLKACGDGEFDVVYFDFMFGAAKHSSTGLSNVCDYAAYDVMTAEHIAEALRVAKMRVVAKVDKAGAAALTNSGFSLLRTGGRRSFCYVGRDA